jgi:hypothetical protein
MSVGGERGQVAGSRLRGGSEGVSDGKCAKEVEICQLSGKRR